MLNLKDMHKDLFEGATIIMGHIHKYFVTAENVYKKRNYNPINIYRWWIKDKEKNIDELEEKTRNTLELLENLRTQIDQLKISTHLKSYSEIIQEINRFTEEHSIIINELLSYVEFLNEKDEIALNMLYHVDIWRSDKNDAVSRSQDEIPQDNKNFDEYLAEFALGVKDGFGVLVYDKVNTDIHCDYYDSIDPEYASKRNPPDYSNQILIHSSWEIKKNFSKFFSNIRKCMRKILEKIDEYWNEEYSEVNLEKQIKKIKEDICKNFNEDIRIKRQFNAVLDNLLTIYASHQMIPLFKTGENIDEDDFHNEVYRRLYSNLGEKVENHKKVAKGNIDFLVYNYPVDVKVEDHEQDLDKIFQFHRDQIATYCYFRKEPVGFLFVYDNTEKTRNFSTKDFDVFKEKNYKIIVILLRGNFPYPSQIKNQK